MTVGMAENAYMSDGELYWSKRGCVACTMHAPVRHSDTWVAEGWVRIPDDARRRHGLTYQCQQCNSETKSPIRHNHRSRIDIARAS